MDGWMDGWITLSILKKTINRVDTIAIERLKAFILRQPAYGRRVESGYTFDSLAVRLRRVSNHFVPWSLRRLAMCRLVNPTDQRPVILVHFEACRSESRNNAKRPHK
jgi:hypothetical protein